MTFSIRKATEKDIPALSAILVGAWQEGFKYIINQDFLEAMTPEEWTAKRDMWLTGEQHEILIAEDEKGAPAGFISFGKLRTPPPGMSPIRPLYSAEIYAVNILPAYWGQGLGTQLIREAVSVLKDMKHKSVCLWVMEKNKRAVSLYKRLGGERCGKKDSEIGNTKVREICFAWRDSSVLLP